MISRTRLRRRLCGSGARRTGSNSARPEVTLLLSTGGLDESAGYAGTRPIPCPSESRTPTEDQATPRILDTRQTPSPAEAHPQRRKHPHRRIPRPARRRSTAFRDGWTAWRQRASRNPAAPRSAVSPWEAGARAAPLHGGRQRQIRGPVPSYGARVLEVRIHLPPAESQVRTCLSREFAFLRREAAVSRGCAGWGERRGRQRRARSSNIALMSGSVSVGRYSSTALSPMRFATVGRR